MTSTNIYQGHEGRTTSRVLKPPGGGHTSLFEMDENSERVKNCRRAQMSSVADCIGQNMERKETPTVANGNAKEVTAAPAPAPPVQQVVEHDKPAEEIKAKEEKKVEHSQPAAQRVRVPPGGFSSGLW